MADPVPLAVPVAFTAWGVLCWFAGARNFLREPRDEIRRIAEVRARSRLVHPLGGGDVDREFERQWRLRWVGYLAIVGFVLGTLGLWFAALT